VGNNPSSANKPFEMHLQETEISFLQKHTQLEKDPMQALNNSSK
jgi:hypothetical protein